MSCRPMGRPRLDKAVGTETAGRPGVEDTLTEGEGPLQREPSKLNTPEAAGNCSDADNPQS